MAIESRIRELGMRHHQLDREIEEEMGRPAADSIRILELKRRKLRLKEKMESLSRDLH